MDKQQVEQDINLNKPWIRNEANAKCSHTAQNHGKNENIKQMNSFGQVL